MHAAYLNQDDLEALEACLDVAMPSEDDAGANKAWSSAVRVVQALRLMLPKEVKGELVIQRR